MRWASLLLIILVPLSVIGSASAANGAAADPSDAATMYALSNQFRQSQGVAPVSEIADLEHKAAAWALNMANQDTLYHSDLRSGISGCYLLVGEIVDQDYNPQAAQLAYENSPHHRAIELDARYAVVGWGAATDDAGRLWTVGEYGQPCSAPAPKPAPAPVPIAAKPTPATRPAPRPAPVSAPPTLAAATTTTTSTTLVGSPGAVPSPGHFAGPPRPAPLLRPRPPAGQGQVPARILELAIILLVLGGLLVWVSARAGMWHWGGDAH